MPKISEDFKSLLPPREAETDEVWKGPVYVLWVFDPMEDTVHIDHNKGRHRALTVTHSDMNPEIVHPGRLNGFAYRIKGGWRITTDEHKALDDPHIDKQVLKALRKEFPPKPLPNVKSD